MENVLYQNSVKRRLLKGEKCSAAWIQLGSPIACEILAESGFDILVIDGEHAPISPEMMPSLMMATKGTGVMPMARVPWNDLVQIKRFLDSGIQGIHIPYICNREEAQRAVNACKYPPIGSRGIAGSPRACGYGQNRNQYIQRINEELLIMLAVETPNAIDQLDDIMEVEGIDGIFIGPFDLSASMGHVGCPGDSEVQEKIHQAEMKIKAAGKLMGTTAGNATKAKTLYERGYDYVIFASDSTSLSSYMKCEIGAFRQYKETCENGKY